MPDIDHIAIEGARVHNLKNISLKVPLHEIAAVVGVSGSGKSSLALGVLYAEGSRRYLESLSTYTRRRMTGEGKASVEEILHVPAALALHQRPGLGSIRSTFGTSSELLNSLRLMFSRLSSHRCPNGHYVKPSIAVAAEEPLACPECKASFFAPSAEELSFNSRGACPHCGGTGMILSVDESTLVPDESLTIEEGAVAPWNSLMWSLMVDVCRAMGVRTDVPFKELTDKEKDIVYHGEAVKKHIFYKPKNSNQGGELDFTYYSAVYTVQNALSKVKDDKGLQRVRKFLKEEICPHCKGTRLSEAARAPVLCCLHLDEACAMTLQDAVQWVQELPDKVDPLLKPMALSIGEAFLTNARRLTSLGLSYLTLDRSTSTLSTGERQRVQIARAVRSRTTGILYVLDEPSIGLHPYNIDGLKALMGDLLEDGNSVILVDHDTQILKAATHFIELGPGAGTRGGELIAQGTAEELMGNPRSVMGPYLKAGTKRQRAVIDEGDLFKLGTIALQTEALHTVKPLDIKIPQGRLTVVTGVSGSGKTTLILESLVPALQSFLSGRPLPSHVKAVDPGRIKKVKLIDASPIGQNVRSTVATYAGIHDELRKIMAKTPAAKERGLKAGDFSYNTGSLRCPRCEGTGTISLDVQFLPDVDIPCPLCRGSRYLKDAELIKLPCKNGNEHSLPYLMSLEASEALKELEGVKGAASRLKILEQLGLGYLTLGEATPLLSGGEAQRLKLSSEITHEQQDALFVFDEPSIGLHPKDVEVLLQVFDSLIEHGATVVVIEHDLDVIKNADYVIDMGPQGGEYGGRVVCRGTLDALLSCEESLTAPYVKHSLGL